MRAAPSCENCNLKLYGSSRLLLFAKGAGRLTPHFAGRVQDLSGDNGKEGKE